MELQPVQPGDAAWATLASFLQQHADVVDDLLAIADVNPPLGRISSIWLGLREGMVVALAYAFPLWPQRPALGVLANTADDEQAAILALAKVGPRDGFVICPRSQYAAWAAAGKAESGHIEWQLTVRREDWQSFPRGECRPGHFDELDRFYRAQGAGAWHPLQFETGPYFVYEQDGEIVAAAGTHFAYEGLAQIGNVFTAPASRGKGLAALTTRAVAEALFERGYATLSLFVESTNHTALGVYQRLGFTQHRELAAFEWSSEPFKQAL